MLAWKRLLTEFRPCPFFVPRISQGNTILSSHAMIPQENLHQSPGVEVPLGEREQSSERPAVLPVEAIGARQGHADVDKCRHALERVSPGMGWLSTLGPGSEHVQIGESVRGGFGSSIRRLVVVDLAKSAEVQAFTGGAGLVIKCARKVRARELVALNFRLPR